MKHVEQELTLVIEPAEGGGFTAYIAEVPGAVYEGETVEEAREMVLEALAELTAYRRELAANRRAAGATVERVGFGF